MPSIATSTLLAITLVSVHANEWVPLRWQAATGPRDVEYLQPSVKVVAGIVSVSVRRDRAVTLKQDPTIAPESNPWTAMDLQVNCPQAKWRVMSAQAVDAGGQVVMSQSGDREWRVVEPGTLAAAVRTRLCPSA
jgi:hypothetical protein